MTRGEYLATRPFDAALALAFFSFLSVRALIEGEIRTSHSISLHEAGVYTRADDPTSFWILFSLFAVLALGSAVYLVWRIKRRKQINQAGP